MVLNKYIAHAGICSRRKAVDLIKEGLVTVKGVTVKDPAYDVTPDDVVKVSGKVIRQESKVYVLLNKPNGYITTVADERGRKTVIDLIKNAPKVRIYPVGRLDRATTGLLVMTNDGEFMERLAHPRYEVEKIYYAVLDKELTHDDMHTISRGVRLLDGKVKVDAISYIPDKDKRHVRISIHSGKNRIIRRIFEHFEYNVITLDRVNYAGLTKKGLRVGSWRYLTSDEVTHLYGFDE
ncbi:MAG: pseudouridine synthase [Candidatus Babeliales bacterium]